MEEEKKKMVMAVDDIPENLQLIQSILKADYSVRIAKNGIVVLRAFDCHLVPDIILLDIEMPGMGGFDLFAEIKRRPQLADVPVIFVTSHGTTDFVKQAVAMGAADYIVKPFEPSVLREKVGKALKKAEENSSPV